MAGISAAASLGGGASSFVFHRRTKASLSIPSGEHLRPCGFLSRASTFARVSLFRWAEQRRLHRNMCLGGESFVLEMSRVRWGRVSSSAAASLGGGRAASSFPEEPKASLSILSCEHLRPGELPSRASTFARGDALRGPSSFVHPASYSSRASTFVFGSRITSSGRVLRPRRDFRRASSIDLVENPGLP